MEIEDAIIGYHAALSTQEAGAIKALHSALGMSAAEVQNAVDEHTQDKDTLPDGWWLALIPILAALAATLRVRLYQIILFNLDAAAKGAVSALQDALVAAGDDRPLPHVPEDRLISAAIVGPDGRSWPQWSAKTADDLFRRLSNDFRTAHTRADVSELVKRAQTLAGHALESTTVTALHSAANRARLLAAGADIRFSRWRYTAVMDNRTSQICQDLNGTEWRFNDPSAPFPPRHPNCRSIVVPLE